MLLHPLFNKNWVLKKIVEVVNLYVTTVEWAIFVFRNIFNVNSPIFQNKLIIKDIVRNKNCLHQFAFDL